uniref:Uncharacterized protein n=1 Tax=Meloidogyne incognita TaxID=6306 RepID=A0A914LWZ0_MELIC
MTEITKKKKEDEDNNYLNEIPRPFPLRPFNNNNVNFNSQINFNMRWPKTNDLANKIILLLPLH